MSVHVPSNKIICDRHLALNTPSHGVLQSKHLLGARNGLEIIVFSFDKAGNNPYFLFDNTSYKKTKANTFTVQQTVALNHIQFVGADI